ncbi:hypothetical protein NHH03_25400 [Stieleria sp. TO1_6]|uniref:hypothetical protein n=1 Tax=Stieleria tagensis TaxID=2956795 RepID=UPI00209A7DB3|nr:hypothetical protein [Stieleria tagensis]MCO8125097.1 hypothetical protein [Stieleria tagensis]
MIEQLLVFVTVWCAVGCWLGGAVARHVAIDNDAASQRAVSRIASAQSVYAWTWLIGALCVCVHIAASYGYVHHWDHAAALQATAIESQRVTGISAAWGVYVNFAFAMIWLFYSAAMLRLRRRLAGWDTAVFLFTGGIVLMASVVFESGTVRWMSLAGFAVLAVISLTGRGKKNSINRD